MRNKSSVTRFLILFALFGAIFAPCPMANASAGNPGVLANIASRAHVGIGDDVVIAGFIITGGSKTVVIRGMGPSTGLFGHLADPTIVLRGESGNELQVNNNWQDDPQQAALIQATGLAPGNAAESAILAVLPPGNYSAALAGNNDGTGIGVIEIYDTAGAGQLGNLSTRAQIGAGYDVLIGGLITRYATSVVIRAIGPSLAPFGVKDPLQDPTLELRDNNGTLITWNDNWEDTQRPEIELTGLAPADPRESAILANLAVPGNYTAIVQGANGTSGTGIVEVYALSEAITFSPNPYYRASNDKNTPTLNWTSWTTGHEIWRDFPNSAAGGERIWPQGQTAIQASPGSYSFTIPISDYASNGQKYYLVDSSVLDTSTRSYRAKVTFAVTTASPPPNIFPRSFVAWANADNLSPEDATTTLARHDLVWMAPEYFGWWWTAPAPLVWDYHSENLDFIPTPDTYLIPTLRAYNPNIKILAVLQHYSLYDAGNKPPPPPPLPFYDTWWLRIGGNRVQSPPGTPQYVLNQDLVGLQNHIVAQAIEIMQSDQGGGNHFDGIFMDHYWPLSAPGYGSTILETIITRIRDALPTALVVVNANEHELPIPIITRVNGVFMESSTTNDWTTVMNSLRYNEADTHGIFLSQQPRINCLEMTGPRSNTARMRATTCLSLIFSNGYALYSGPLAEGDHNHNWYHPFWSNHSLGEPIPTATPYHIVNGHPAWARDFQNGTAVWNPPGNPPGNPPVTFTFPQMRTNQSNVYGTRATQFTLPANDGGIYTFQ